MKYNFFNKHIFPVISIIVLAVVFLFAGAVISKYFHPKHNKKQVHSKFIFVDCDRSLYATVPIESTRQLNDKNDVQLLHAHANGLKDIFITNASFEADSAQMVTEHKLVHLMNNPFYQVKEMTHSYPFTVPEMADLLNDMATLFRQKLQEKKQDTFRFIVSSGLRTSETQQELTTRNRNASTQSAHLFGATLDITYKDFYNVKTGNIEQNYYAAEALRETMQDLREECRLVVVRERRQACYHFTVVNCDPLKIPKKQSNTAVKDSL